MVKLIFNFFVVPGFLFTAVVGLIATWVDRKVSARLQYRQGPPWYQPFADVCKLLGKETMVPEGVSRVVFLGAPLLGLAAVTVVATMVGLANLFPGSSFIGDLIVVLYLLTLPSTAVIIGGSASRNPLAALGASREMKLILAYELPFLIAIFTLVSRTGSLLLGNFISYQQTSGMLVQSFSGLITFVVAMLVIQAKLTVVPFDIPEAEQEIAAGPYLEYSGPALAVYKLTRAMLFWVLPLFLMTLFMGGVNITSWPVFLWSVVKYVIILTLIILLKNTNPRLRIDQAVRFFWGPATILAAAGFILARFGL